MKRLDHAGFPGRLAFLRWVRHLEVGEPPTNEAIAKAAEHTGQWLTGLLKEGRAPAKAEDHHAVAAFFDVDGDWLFYNEGGAPHAQLWALWVEARRRAITLPAAPEVVVRGIAKKPVKTPRQAGGGPTR